MRSLVRALGWLILAGAAGCGAVSRATEPGEPAVILSRPGATSLELLAAREVRRYLYQTTGALLPIVTGSPDHGAVIRLALDPSLPRESFRLRSGRQPDGSTLGITGGSDLALLYGAYRLAEIFGARFSLYGDVLPDRRGPFSIPVLDETHAPLFERRGILPFHDFPEGPDWWDRDNWLAVLSQMAKMRMNTVGLHCYPEGGVGPEPLVWIGLAADVREDGSVRVAFPSRWASTRGGAWGYAAMDTGDYAAGASRMFPADDFGPEVTRGHRPAPVTAGGSIEVFDRAGAMVRDVLVRGREVGIGAVLGTETPLTIPAAVRERLAERGIDPASPEAVRRLYEGIFTRIARRQPIVAYWLWTPEGWTWSGADPEQVEATLADLRLAQEALHAVGHPFGLATCGWVLGPPADPGLFDRELPAWVAMSCINRQVGFSPVEPAFSEIRGRQQWAIPWLEDDPALTTPQLWVGRMRRDAADALAFGCTGLLGIHWRTRVLDPNVAALARAAWEQRGWNPDLGREVALPVRATTDVHAGGRTAAIARPIAGTELDEVYRSCRWDVKAYRLRVPNGSYHVRLQFCEITYKEPGKRVFGLRIEDEVVAEGVDVVARAGPDTAFDLVFDDVAVRDGELTIGFLKEIEYPFVAGIVVEGGGGTRRINCGGAATGAFEGDLPEAGSWTGWEGRPRDLPSSDFYEDWARSRFGPQVAAPVARLFVRLDGMAPGAGPRGTKLPRPADWIRGPGGIRANRAPWEQEKERYAFVDELAALRPRVETAGNRERFDYWLGTFRLLREIGHLGCLRGALDASMERIEGEGDPARRRSLAEREALPLRLELARAWETMMTLQLAVVDTPGGMGTIANLEQHVRGNNRFLDAHDQALAALLGGGLPPEAQPRTSYLGAPRLVVPTRRSRVRRGEEVTLRVILLDRHDASSIAVHWRPMGFGSFQSIPCVHLGRGVYAATLPPARGEALECYAEALTADGTRLRWPATAPGLNHTMVVGPDTIAGDGRTED